MRASHPQLSFPHSFRVTVVTSEHAFALIPLFGLVVAVVTPPLSAQPKNETGANLLKVRKKAAAEDMVFDGTTGAIIPSVTSQSPTEIPDIIERYVAVVGRMVHGLAQQPEFSTKDINAVASLGRAVAMLQAVEEARISRVGGKAVREIPTSELRKLVAASEREDIDE